MNSVSKSRLHIILGVLLLPFMLFERFEELLSPPLELVRALDRVDSSAGRSPPSSHGAPAGGRGR